MKEIANAARESDSGTYCFIAHSGILENARKLSDSCQSSSYGITSPLDAVTGTARKIASMTELAEDMVQVIDFSLKEIDKNITEYYVVVVPEGTISTNGTYQIDME